MAGGLLLIQLVTIMAYTDVAFWSVVAYPRATYIWAQEALVHLYRRMGGWLKSNLVKTHSGFYTAGKTGGEILHTKQYFSKASLDTPLQYSLILLIHTIPPLSRPSVGSHLRSHSHNTGCGPPHWPNSQIQQHVTTAP